MPAPKDAAPSSTLAAAPAAGKDRPATQLDDVHADAQQPIHRAVRRRASTDLGEDGERDKPAGHHLAGSLRDHKSGLGRRVSECPQRIRTQNLGISKCRLLPSAASRLVPSPPRTARCQPPLTDDVHRSGYIRAYVGTRGSRSRQDDVPSCPWPQTGQVYHFGRNPFLRPRACSWEGSSETGEGWALERILARLRRHGRYLRLQVSPVADDLMSRSSSAPSGRGHLPSPTVGPRMRAALPLRRAVRRSCRSGAVPACDLQPRGARRP